MLTSLRKFKEHLDLMEADFEQAMQNNGQMNKMMRSYETAMVSQFGGGNAPKFDAQGNPLVKVPVSNNHKDVDSNDPDMSSFMVFDQLEAENQEGQENGDERDAFEQLNDRMQNPFTIMRRWLKFEILDLEAILDAIAKSNEMDK